MSASRSVDPGGRAPGNSAQSHAADVCDLCGFESGLPLTYSNASNPRCLCAVSYAVGTPVRSQSPLPSVATAASCTTRPIRIGGGATGTIRPSTSPRMPTSGFEDRGAHLSPCTPVPGMRLQDGVDLLFEVGLGLVADDPISRFAAAEQDQAGNTEHAELGRRLWVGVDVELSHCDPAGVLDRQLLDHRPQHLAGRAPGCPEVEEHGLLGRADSRLEILIGDLDDVLACHASSSTTCPSSLLF